MAASNNQSGGQNVGTINNYYLPSNEQVDLKKYSEENKNPQKFISCGTIKINNSNFNNVGTGISAPECLNIEANGSNFNTVNKAFDIKPRQ